MNNIEINYYKTEIGELILGSFDGKLCLLDYRFRKHRNSVDKRLKRELHADYVEKDNELLKETRKQIDQYLKGTVKEFKLPILMVGTTFQKNVWKELIKIQYGKTMSYLELANMMNNERAVRAVANANGANALSLIIPCHRIIGSNGKLVGYAGGLDTKSKLLYIEHNIIIN